MQERSPPEVQVRISLELAVVVTLREAFVPRQDTLDVELHERYVPMEDMGKAVSMVITVQSACAAAQLVLQ